MIKIKKISELKYEVEDNPFYVDGKGGQLGDRGFISDIKILEVGENFVILEKELEDGNYTYQIDFIRREDIKKQHTAQHIFSALAYKKYNLNTVGFRMGEEYTTVDLDSKNINKEMITDLENSVNEIITENIEIEEIIYTNEEAHKLKNLRKQVKDKIKGDVRFIKISDVDICACAGFHVKKTSEIKLFKIINYEVIKGNWTRFYFLAGDRARFDYAQKHNITRTLTNIFSCKTEEILDMLEKSLEEKKKMEQDLKSFLHKYTETLAKNIEKDFEEYKNNKIIIYNEDKNIADILGRYINLDEFLLISGYDKSYALMSNNNDCQRLIKEITKKFSNIKGGGSQKKGNIKLDRNYTKNEILEIIRKGIDE